MERKSKANNRPEFLNKERYVVVKDMRFGTNGSYTDYEELAFSNVGDQPWYGWLQEEICRQGWSSWEKDVSKKRNVCDLLHYNVVHVLSWWVSCGEVITKDMVVLAVETSLHLLVDVLGCNEVMRAEPGNVTYWDDLVESRRK